MDNPVHRHYVDVMRQKHREEIADLRAKLEKAEATATASEAYLRVQVHRAEAAERERDEAVSRAVVDRQLAEKWDERNRALVKRAEAVEAKLADLERETKALIASSFAGATTSLVCVNSIILDRLRALLKGKPETEVNIGDMVRFQMPKPEQRPSENVGTFSDKPCEACGGSKEIVANKGGGFAEYEFPCPKCCKGGGA